MFQLFSLEQAVAPQPFEPSSLGGDYTYRAFAPADFDEVGAFAELHVCASQVTGSIAETATLTTEDSASSRYEATGTFSVQRE